MRRRKSLGVPLMQMVVSIILCGMRKHGTRVERHVPKLENVKYVYRKTFGKMWGITARPMDLVSVSATNAMIETVLMYMSNQLSEQPANIMMDKSITLGDRHANILLLIINYLVLTFHSVTLVIFIS
jgi:hypothetical protein